MAQYRLSMSIISRAQGQSAVAGAAYQSGERLYCQRDGKYKDYSRKERVLEKGIKLPKNAPERLADREKLWNEIEAIEKSKNARLARSFELSLQAELSYEENKANLEKFIERNFTSKGLIVDYAIHDQVKNNGNIHAHLKVTTRPIDENGKWAPKQKKIYLDENGNDLAPDDKEHRIYNKQKKTYKCRTEKLTDLDSKETLQEWRQSWQDIQNKAFNRAGLDIRLDCRTLKAQGFDRAPQRHQGYSEEIKKENIQRKEINDEIKKLKGEIENEESKRTDNKRTRKQRIRRRRKRASEAESARKIKQENRLHEVRRGDVASAVESSRAGVLVRKNDDVQLHDSGTGQRLERLRRVDQLDRKEQRVNFTEEQKTEMMKGWKTIQPVWQLKADEQLFYAKAQQKLWKSVENELSRYVEEQYLKEFRAFEQTKINPAIEQGRIKINAEFDNLSQDYRKRLAEYNKLVKQIDKLDGELVKKQGFFSSLFGDKKEREAMEKQLDSLIKQQKAEQADLLSTKKHINSRSEALKQSDEGIYTRMKKDFEKGFEKRYSDVYETIREAKEAAADFRKIDDERYLELFRASENKALMQHLNTNSHEFMNQHYYDIVERVNKKPRPNIGKALKNLRITNRGKYIKGLARSAKNSRKLCKTLFKRGKELMKAVKEAVKAVGQVLATIVAACFGKVGGGSEAGAGKAAVTKDNLLSNNNTSLFKSNCRSKFDDDDKETQHENVSEGRLENQNKWDKIEEQKSKGDQDAQEPDLDSGVGSAELDKSDPLSRLDEWEWLSDLEKEDLEAEMARRKG